MKRISLVLTAILSVAATHGYAESMSFTVEQGILTYSQMSSTTKTSGATAVKETETVMSTMPNSLQVCGSLGNLNLYFYPTQPSTAFGAGYKLKKNLELGGTLALNSDKLDKAKLETSTTTVGFWATLAVPAGHGNVEISAPLTMSTGTEKSASTTDKLSGTTFQLVGNYFQPIAKNFSWFGGLGYKMDSQTKKTDGGGKQTVNSNGLVLNLTSFRFTF